MTAVKFLIEQLNLTLPINQINDVVIQNLFNQAKEIEKQQLEKCAIYFTNYAIDTIEGKKEINGEKQFEQYYNETFNK
jgi:hypothetical protein